MFVTQLFECKAFSNRGRSPVIIKTAAPRRVSRYPLPCPLYITVLLFPYLWIVNISTYTNIPRFTLIAMNGNTIIGGNKTPRIDDRIRENAGGSDGLEYVTQLQGDGDGLAGRWKSQCAPAGCSRTRSVRLAI